ncbi:PH domain-containing protein [Fodinicola acaciae]|uniref:PH domain-containing protein n=1 Tax=Fodinicola acaciae TaxID=2681555 RepID=UPI0013D3BC8F|nr:PH domain-containing protein [Fodinicola acaciae]
MTAANDEGWQRLDPRMLLIRPVRELARFAIPLLGVFIFGRFSENNTYEYWSLAGVVLVIAAGILHWFTTTYRIGPDQVELRSGLLNRRHLGVPRDRIRTVDMSSDLMHRLFKLSAVTIGTGQQNHERHEKLKLDAITTDAAAALRTQLLHRATAGPSTLDKPVAAQPAEVELARLDPKWLRFAPFTLSGLAAVGAAAGIFGHSANDVRVAIVNYGPVKDTINSLQQMGILVAIAVILVALVLVVAICSTVAYVLAYWNFRLTREQAGTLHIRRGLLTTRSVSIEERRLRGVEIKEALPLRLVRGGRVNAVAAGLSNSGKGAERSSGGLLLPPAPLAEAHKVAAKVLKETTDPTTTQLVRHPVAAMTRRFTRAFGVTALIILVLGALVWIDFLPLWVLLLSLVLLPIAAVLAWDRYRNLGHALTDRYLVSRKGSLHRETAAIGVDGIIGWRVHRSFFQRRAGLVTLVATTGTPHGGHPVVDITEAEAMRLIAGSTPSIAPTVTEAVRVPDNSGAVLQNTTLHASRR